MKLAQMAAAEGIKLAEARLLAEMDEIREETR